VGGSAVLEGDRLTITLGPSTMAFCGEESLDQRYLELLGKVGGYALENGRLVLHLSADAGMMTFDVAGESDAEADDIGSDITGVTWRWEQTTTPVGVIKSADAPDKYTIQLLPDGQLQFSADCNTGRGTYTLQGAQLSFEIGPMTRAACPPDSLSDEFIEELQAAAITFVEGGELYIDLIYDSGTMRFSRGE
jgi:heat shock protein HslJ